MAGFDGVQPGIVEHVVVRIQVDGLLHGAGVHPGEAADGHGQVAV